jgi:flagellar basal-body rod modification protein FlgD
MINAPKAGVTTWNDKRDVIQKPEGINNLGAEDQKKFGDQNVGDVLNKIADPNYIDPTKKMRTVGNDKLDKDAFLKLMLAQMKHQDPTSPLKSHEMAAQLASFSSLEQLNNMNRTLEAIQTGQKPSENFQVLNLIGKSVQGDSSKLTRSKGDTEHDFQFVLPDDASDVQVKIRNENGDVVRVYDLLDLKKGDNKITWNGQDSNGNTQAEGEYSFLVEATSKAGKKLAVKSDFEGTITGVNYRPEGPVLLIGNQTIKMKDVRKIIDPSLKNNDQNIKNVNPQDLKAKGDTKQNESKSKAAVLEGAPEANKGASQIMSNVGMSNEMLSKVAKETAPEVPKK